MMDRVKRFALITLVGGVVHSVLALGLAAVATSRAEREVFEGTLPAHALYRVLGEVARVLFYPLMSVRSEVYEPRTTILFVANSLTWGIAVAAVWSLYSRWRTAKSKLP